MPGFVLDDLLSDMPISGNSRCYLIPQCLINLIVSITVCFFLVLHKVKLKTSLAEGSYL
jgi:hypothetical protein